MDRKSRNSLFLAAALLALAALGYGGSGLAAASRPAATAEISVDGAVIPQCPLDQDLDLIIEGSDGGTNHLVIENGSARITEASCPDKLCVRQGAASETGQTIVCLPNRVIVTIR